MKLSQKDLEQQTLLPPAPQIVTGVQYDKTLANIEGVDNISVYQKRILDSVQAKGWRLVDNLKVALTSRANGERALTFREADCAERGRVDICNELFLAVFIGSDNFGAMLVEMGVPGDAQSTWELRSTYNRGLEWKKTKRATATPEIQEIGDKKLELTRQSLAMLCAPLWEEEVVNGVPTELCKPEYMSWSQYQQAAQLRLRILNDEFRSN